MKRMKAGKSFPVRGRVTSQLVRTLRRPCLNGFGSSKTLVSHPLTEKWCHQLTVSVIYSYIYSYNFSFSFFAGPEDVKGDGWTKKICNPPGMRGIPGARVGHGGYPPSQVVDFMSAGVHKAGESALPSSGAPSPSVDGWWAPSPFGQAPKRAHNAHTTTASVAPKEEEVTLQEVPLPLSPSQAIVGPLGISMLPAALQRGPLVPCHIPQLALPATSFIQVNLKDSSRCTYAGSAKSIPPTGTQLGPTAFRNI